MTPAPYRVTHDARGVHRTTGPDDPRRTAQRYVYDPPADRLLVLVVISLGLGFAVGLAIAFIALGALS